MKNRTKLWLVVLLSVAGSIVLFLTVSTLTGKVWNKGYSLKMLDAISENTLSAIERQDAYGGSEARRLLDEAHDANPDVRLEWVAPDGTTLYDTAGLSKRYDFPQLAGRIANMPDRLWSGSDTPTLVYPAADGSRSYYLLLSVPSEAMKQGQLFFYLRSNKALAAFVLPLLLAVLLPYLLSLWFFSSTNRRIGRLNGALKLVGLRTEPVMLKDAARDEIGQLTRHYNAMAERLRSQASQIEQFEARRRLLLSNLSHDLRTPLTMILGYAETIRAGAYKDEGELQAGAKVILQRSRYMDKLLDQLLDIARPEGDAFELHPAPHNLSELMRKLAAEYMLFLDGKSFDMEADIPDEDVFAVIDAPLVERALRNLLDNALRYGEEGRYLRIGLAEKEAEVRIAVADRGSGIAPGDRERVFERFYRADGGRKGDGLGIGLSIVREIAESHGGSARLLDASGGETVFEIRLPKHASA